MPTFTPKFLANGQLPNAKGTLYTCPIATQALIKSIILVNVSGANLTGNIYVKKATSRRIIAKDTTFDIAVETVIERNLTLDAGDLIEGDASGATSIDFCIFGIEQS